jgi:hypothetical protein
VGWSLEGSAIFFFDFLAVHLDVGQNGRPRGP